MALKQLNSIRRALSVLRRRSEPAHAARDNQVTKPWTEAAFNPSRPSDLDTLGELDGVDHTSPYGREGLISNPDDH